MIDVFFTLPIGIPIVIPYVMAGSIPNSKVFKRVYFSYRCVHYHHTKTDRISDDNFKIDIRGYRALPL